MRALNRLIRRIFRNAFLRYRTRGLLLREGADVRNTKLGNYNLICPFATVSNCELGDFTYVGMRTRLGRAKIGKFCSIGPEVVINMGTHPTDFVSTHPVFYSRTFGSKIYFAETQGFEEYANVEIGHDVWIGARVIVLPGVTISTGSIIAAGAVVSRDVEPYSIIGGVPGKLIRKRFDDETIAKLLESQWWDLDIETLKQNHLVFHSLNSFDEFMKHHAQDRVAGE